ncbi:hypothetical protein B5X24_HaOG215752 [Helicoverpa armigera]|uniref:Uncharacterized protein n=1 Tax=Helicoverpa armigera TaxID=29058 RepID=A0A2W1B8H6_HELAM|nr:hypothetical protein B5X24_HaOG215752 [Helicoverpa armigera]
MYDQVSCAAITLSVCRQGPVAAATYRRRTAAAPGSSCACSLTVTHYTRHWALGTGHWVSALVVCACAAQCARVELLARLAAHDGALHAVAAPALGRLLLTACTHSVLKVFDLAEVCRSGSGEAEAPAPLAWLDGVHDLGALCADASQDGQLAATGGQDSLTTDPSQRRALSDGLLREMSAYPVRPSRAKACRGCRIVRKSYRDPGP